MVVAVEAMQAKGGGWQIQAAQGSGVPRAVVSLWAVNSLGDGLFPGSVRIREGDRREA